jgi:hypothetical protein
MVAVRSPLGVHASRTIGVLERVVERKQRNALGARVLGDQGVQPPDLRLGVRPAVVPRQQVDDDDAQPELFAATHHRAQVGGRVIDRSPLRDVVDAALDDEQIGAGDTVLEPGPDLVRALAVDPMVAKLEPGLDSSRPVLPLARLVTAAA